MKVTCWICHRYAAPTLKVILRHMAAVHAHDPTFHTICGIEECPRTYTNFSFKRHLYRKHRGVLDLMPVSPDVVMTVSDDIEDGSSSCEVNATEIDEKKESALFIMKAKTVHKVSQSALSGLLDDFSSMLERKIGFIQEGVEKITNNMPAENQTSIAKLFQEPSISTPFIGLETQHFQEKYFVEKLGLLVSLQVGICKYDNYSPV